MSPSPRTALMSPATAKLWQILRRKSLGCRVHRRKYLHGHLVDFYVPKLGWAIEVDGTTRDVETDRARDRDLLARGIRTLRLSNEFVLEKSGFDLLAFTVVALGIQKGKGSEAGS